MRIAIIGLWAMVSILNCASLATAGEAQAGSFAIQDVGTEWFKALFSMGVAGCFIVYLIYDRHVERTRKDKENERWQRMETVMIEMVGSTTKCIMEITASHKELRMSVDTLVTEMNRLVTIISTGSEYRRRATDARE